MHLCVGDTKFSDVQYEGTFFVLDKHDDDWVGAVFAFQVSNFLYSSVFIHFITISKLF